LSTKPQQELHAGLVSVGVPVYNGARYLSGTLDSLLAQTYADYEIIISDNASQDETESICREYAARDRRVRYYRSEENKGPFWNYLRVYELACGEYFMWHALDDLRAPRCLSLCVDAFRRNPSAVMCCMDAAIIDENGRELPDLPIYRIYHPTGATVYERLRDIARSRIGTDFYALFKTAIIPSTRFGKIKVWGGDTIFTAEVCMLGDVIAVPQKLFHYRLFESKTAEQMAESLQGWATDMSARWLGLVVELMEAVRLAPLDRVEKIRLNCMLAMEMCLRDPYWAAMIGPEGFRGLRAALRARDYRRVLRLDGLGMLGRSRPVYELLRNSARAGRLKNLLASRRAAPQ
jgi:glycosyltransferase involved in cell wall biosynthesis